VFSMLCIILPTAPSSLRFQMGGKKTLMGTVASSLWMGFLQVKELQVEPGTGYSGGRDQEYWGSKPAPGARGLA
jgi:hypothetical protein